MKPPSMVVEFKTMQQAKTIQAALTYLNDLEGKIHRVIGEIETRQSDLAQMEERHRLITAMLETLGCAPQSKA